MPPLPTEQISVRIALLYHIIANGFDILWCITYDIGSGNLYDTAFAIFVI